MSERTSYEPGTPSWVDLSTPDPAASKRFYGALFGWEAEDASGSVEETGGYAMFKLRGLTVAGIGPIMGEGQPTVWSTYISTDDADAVVARAIAAGGSAVVGPMEVMDAGRMAFVAHEAGGTVGVWEPARTIGAQLVNEPGAFTWNELHARDLKGASAFYTAVFGWVANEQDYDGGSYTMFNVGDAPVAGMGGFPPGTPDEVPPSWLTYFAVADCDATVATARELGASVAMEPMDAPGIGRMAALADPHGAAFAVIATAA
jgi:predicted enzyme related to lactoylglutathione lyase